MAGSRNKTFPPYEEAQRIARSLGITSRIDYGKSNFKALGLPAHPQFIYRNIGWESWMKYLGYKRTMPYAIKWLSIHKAREIVQPLYLNSSTDYFAWHAKHKPQGLPRNPQVAYLKKGWQGWLDFIGCPCSRPDRGIMMYGGSQERNSKMRTELLAMMKELTDPNLSLERFNEIHKRLQEMK